jgi:hypothetical protein
MSVRVRPVAAPVLALIALGAAAVALGALAGCGAAGGTPGSASTAPADRRCGTSRTSAGVPVEVVVEHGSVACQAALAVERDYARALASGKVPGNGGGAPVTIRGWVCQGFTTPRVLATGHTSACRKAGEEILEILPSPSSSPTF